MSLPSATEILEATIFISKIISKFMTVIEDRAELCDDLREVLLKVRLTATIAKEYIPGYDQLDGWNRSLRGFHEAALRLEEKLGMKEGQMAVRKRMYFAIWGGQWAEEEVARLRHKAFALDELNKMYVSIHGSVSLDTVPVFNGAKPN